jgi:AhpC/TSA family
MAALLPPLISIAGFVLYFVVTTRLGVYRRVPWEYVAVIASGVLLGVVQLRRNPGLATAAGTLVAAAVLGLSSWYLFSYSMFAAREDRPAIGDAFPDFTLPTSDGGTYRLADASGTRRLLIFYRGAW